MAGRPFVLKDFMTAVYASAIVPPPLIGAEVLGTPLPGAAAAARKAGADPM